KFISNTYQFLIISRIKSIRQLHKVQLIKGDGEMEVIKRIHHIAAIVGEPNENLRFYRDVLGLRLIKQTVNFDDSGVYHLYFGDYNGNPGTIITFFPWTND